VKGEKNPVKGSEIDLKPHTYIRVGALKIYLKGDGVLFAERTTEFVAWR
jgi:hypothetical protein